MKKIILPVIASFAILAPSILIAQEPSYALINERKDLRHEKKEISKEEKGIRKDERATKREEVSYFTRESFKKDFPDAKDIGYSVGKNFDEVYYNLNGQSYIAYYDGEAKLVGTTTESRESELPASAQKEINRKYIDKGFTLDKVILYDDNEESPTDMWLYERAFSDFDNYFIELSKAGKKLVLQVDMKGNVSYFKTIL